MPCETQEDTNDRRETLAATGRSVPKTPRPIGSKAAKANEAKKRDFEMMMCDHFKNQKNSQSEQLRVYKEAIDRQAENQKGLSAAISILSSNMRRSSLPEDSAAARAADELEIAEMELKREEINLRRAEVAIKAEESRRRLRELQRGEDESEVEAEVEAEVEEVEAEYQVPASSGRRR